MKCGEASLLNGFHVILSFFNHKIITFVTTILSKIDQFDSIMKSSYNTSDTLNEYLILITEEEQTRFLRATIDLSLHTYKKEEEQPKKNILTCLLNNRVYILFLDLDYSTHMRICFVVYIYFKLIIISPWSSFED